MCVEGDDSDDAFCVPNELSRQSKVHEVLSAEAGPQQACHECKGCHYYHCHSHLIWSSKEPHEVGMRTPVLQMRKLRPTRPRSHPTLLCQTVAAAETVLQMTARCEARTGLFFEQVSESPQACRCGQGPARSVPTDGAAGLEACGTHRQGVPLGAGLRSWV